MSAADAATQDPSIARIAIPNFISAPKKTIKMLYQAAPRVHDFWLRATGFARFSFPIQIPPVTLRLKLVVRIDVEVQHVFAHAEGLVERDCRVVAAIGLHVDDVGATRSRNRLQGH